MRGLFTVLLFLHQPLHCLGIHIVQGQCMCQQSRILTQSTFFLGCQSKSLGVFTNTLCLWMVLKREPSKGVKRK
ncbi:hypothetical protein BDF14DRAFT_1788257 [Spinellus fusiger]|nr:hypothetical protein BDF14DRAFT_1788257 [Spinellus fusiger]